MKYGLIGEKLGHSYSCQVHRALGNPDYVLKEIAPDALGDFLRARDFAGLNVTIPYKQAVIPYVDALTDTAREVGAVNTLYFDASGALWGDNTDVYGFCTMLEGIDVRGKKALVLGSGGTSHTACYALRALGAGDCIVVSRRGAVNYENVYSLHADAEVIVNATPVGMFPNNGARPIDIRRFPRLCAVADVIYNPARTALLQDADALGIPRAGGLSTVSYTHLFAGIRHFSRVSFDSAALSAKITHVQSLRDLHHDMVNQPVEEPKRGKALSRFNRPRRRVRRGRGDFCVGKSHFPERKSLPCSFRARKSAGF